MFLWLKRKLVREGQTIVHWPAKDFREDILVVDTSRLSEGLVGVRRRAFGVHGRTTPPPDFLPNVEWLTFRRVWWGQFDDVESTEPPPPRVPRRRREVTDDRGSR